MPCKATAPINVPSAVNQKCTVKCNFEYNFGLSSCSVTTEENYLDIMCYDGKNTIKSDMLSGSLTVTGTRLYAPSLNSYDGFKADAELIIILNGGGKNLCVCIPVKSSETVGRSAKWFSQVIPFAPTKKGSGSKVNVNVNNFTLNDVMPMAPYIIYEGGTFSADAPFNLPCASDNVMIIFNKDSAINMKLREYSKLTKLINRISAVPSSIANPLQFNAKGTTSGPGKKTGKSKTFTCKPITYPDGSPIPEEAQDRLKWVTSGNMNTSGLPNNSEIWNKYGRWILIGLAAVLLLAILGYAASKGGFALRDYLRARRAAQASTGGNG